MQEKEKRNEIDLLESNELFGASAMDLDTLLKNPFGENVPSTAKPDEVKSTRLLETLKPEHQAKARELAMQIETSNPQAIMQYGIGAQADLSKFSHNILSHVQMKDSGPVGEVIGDLMSKIREVHPEDFGSGKRGIFARMFGSVSKSVQQVLMKYQRIGLEIDKIAAKLEKNRQLLFKDIMLLEQMYEKNKEYFEALNIYIAAAELKLEELRTRTIPELERKARESNDQMVVQDVNDLVQFAERLEKRTHDLKISRQITIQTAPQLRMIQHMNQTLVERIQSSILTSIPLWKNQVVIALTLFRQKKAVEAQRKVTETTNELLLKNSEMLKVNSVEVAKENERSIVDIDTLKKTQENLIETLEEVMKIQEEGRQRRASVERELVVMEEELKRKLFG